MDNPQYLYYASVALLVLPAVPFCRVAGVVLLTFAVSFQGPVAAVVAMGAGAVLCAMLAQCTMTFLIAAVYLNLFVVGLAGITGGIHPYHAYWTDYWLSLTRNLLVPFICDWGHARATLRGGARGYWDYRDSRQLWITSSPAKKLGGAVLRLARLAN